MSPLGIYCEHGITKSRNSIINRNHMSAIIKELLVNPSARNDASLLRKATDQQSFLPWND